MTEVCLFWTISLGVDFFLSLKNGRFPWKDEDRVLNFHKILHCLIGSGYIFGGLFVAYYFKKPVYIILCLFYSFYAVISHFLIAFKKMRRPGLLRISDLLCLAASAALSLKTTMIMGYKPFVFACISLILLAFLFFILSLIKSRQLYFILEKLFCSSLMVFFTMWFLL